MLKTRSILSVLFVTILGATATAQTAADDAHAKLARAFEGKTVTVNIDMPATNRGIDVKADRAGSIEREKNQKRLKTYGTAIKIGDAAKVTGINVNGNEISFELAGGGAPDIDIAALIGPKPEGTTANIQEARARMRVNSASGDKIDTSNVNSSLKSMSAERKRNDAERLANYETRRRNAIESYRHAAMQQGSRFVIRFDRRDPASLTPEELRRILAEFVSF